MTINLYLGNLPFSTVENDIYDLLEEFGVVYSVSMITDPNTGRFQGFCYAEMEESAGVSAIQGLDGHDFNGRPLRVNEARSRSSS